MAMSPTASYPGDAVPIVDRLTSVPDLAPGPLHRILGALGADWLAEVDAVVAAGG
jgi:hypothetical protein